MLGYQIEHKETGRLFPFTKDFEVFTKKAAKQFLNNVDDYVKTKLDINVNDYKLVKVYSLPTGHHLIV